MMKRATTAILVTVFATSLVGCGSSAAPDLESLGLAIAVDVQAGGDFDLVVPARDDTTIELVSSPPGVDASVTEVSGGESIRVAIAADPDTPRGSYNLALRVTQDGEDYELGLPFDVVDPETDTTQPGQADAVLTVESPDIGAVFPSQSTVSGQSSSDVVGYNLLAGDDVVLAQGTVDVIDGAFSVELEFTNDCCIEMMLQIFQPGADGLSTSIPLAYPESG